MHYIIKILSTILFIVIGYLIIILLFPDFGKTIDKKTSSNYNSFIQNKFNGFLNDLGGAKNDTDDFIDGVGKNSKNRSREFQGTLNDMRNASK